MTTYDDLEYLLSPDGQQQLATLSQEQITPANHLLLAMRLRKTVTPIQAQALLELALAAEAAWHCQIFKIG